MTEARESGRVEDQSENCVFQFTVGSLIGIETQMSNPVASQLLSLGTHLLENIHNRLCLEDH